MATLNPNRRIDVDSVLKCEGCGCVPYKIFRRQEMLPDGTLLSAHSSVLWPAHPDVTPPLHPEDPRCPECRCALKRVAP